MAQNTDQALWALLAERFGDAPEPLEPLPHAACLENLAKRGSCRAFLDQDVPSALIETLCAVALASPTKSDLQQRDIVILRSKEKRERLAQLVSGQSWVAQAPMLLVFCGNNRRQRLLHRWHGVPFANDHLDAFFNAAADAAIALGAFVTAAELAGLGCCPISAVRNAPHEVSDLLGLPNHVFPFAGLAVGYPETPARISKRLPLHVTCHVDEYREEGLHQAVQAYDEDRSATQPYAKQRLSDQFGISATYGWSEDKARQYSQPERADFGAFIRAKGFRLE